MTLAVEKLLLYHLSTKLCSIDSASVIASITEAVQHYLVVKDMYVHVCVSLLIDIIFATLDARMTINNTTKISEATHTYTYSQSLLHTTFHTRHSHTMTLH